MSNLAPILVLAMHRSGTSVLTGLLEKMGFYVGEKDKLIPANPDNPKGFYERRDAIAVNQAILLHCGCNWYLLNKWNMEAPPRLTSDFTDPIRPIIASLQMHQPWALKEPRLCLTLPYWKPYIGNPVVVVMYRDPLEIAQSLLLRNSMPIPDGLALWERYIEGLFYNTQDMQKVYCNYDTLVVDPVGTISKLHHDLSALGYTPAMPDDAEITSFVVSGLKRAVRVNHQMTEKQLRLARLMQGL